MIRGDNDTLAVVDSKYYAEGNDPVRKSPTRSQLFSYAYLLDTDRLGFLCPLQPSETRTVVQTDAELQIVSPSVDSFDIGGYRQALHDYLYSILLREEPILEVFCALERPYSELRSRLCLEGVDKSDLSAVTSMSGPFTYHDLKRFSWGVIQRAGRLSWNAGSVAELEDEGKQARYRVEEELNVDGRSPYATTCVPLFTTDGADEWLTLYFVNTGGQGGVNSERIELRTE
jgi:hypothetical protein